MIIKALLATLSCHVLTAYNQQNNLGLILHERFIWGNYSAAKGKFKSDKYMNTINVYELFFQGNKNRQPCS